MGKGKWETYAARTEALDNKLSSLQLQIWIHAIYIIGLIIIVTKLSTHDYPEVTSVTVEPKAKVTSVTVEPKAKVTWEEDARKARKEYAKDIAEALVEAGISVSVQSSSLRDKIEGESS